MVIAVRPHKFEDGIGRKLAACHNKPAFIGAATKLDGIATAGFRHHFCKADAITGFDPPSGTLIGVKFDQDRVVLSNRFSHFFKGTTDNSKTIFPPIP